VIFKMIDQIAQAWIILFGIPAIWLVGRLEKWKRWGYIFGLLSQPAWLYTSIVNEQYGIMVLVLWYTYSWGQGVYNYWIKDK